MAPCKEAFIELSLSLAQAWVRAIIAAIIKLALSDELARSWRRAIAQRH